MISWLTFSDSAKYAEAAVSILNGSGYVLHHAFFRPELINNFTPGSSFPARFLPLTTWALVPAFKFFGSNDLTINIVGVVSGLLILILSYVLARLLHSRLAGIIALLLLTTSISLWSYVLNFSTEILLTLLLLISSTLFVRQGFFKKLLGLFFLGLGLFSRPQAYLAIVALSLSWVGDYLFVAKKYFRALMVVGLILVGAVLTWELRDHRVSPLSYIGSLAVVTNNPGDYLRGDIGVVQLKSLTVKVFYNTYNFVKAPERIASPIIILLFLTLPIIIKNNRRILYFFYSALLFIGLLILAASATIPNARYIHPILPFLCIGAGVSLVELSKKFNSKFILPLLVVVLTAIPAIGYITLDARFRSTQFNQDKPNTTKAISEAMANTLPKGQLIITNLDAWASWYNGLTTMWFPLSPDLLEKVDPSKKVPYIVITNYLENDKDFNLGSWKEVVYSPDDIQHPYLNSHYQVKETFVLSADSLYENQEIKGTILELK